MFSTIMSLLGIALGALVIIVFLLGIVMWIGLFVVDSSARKIITGVIIGILAIIVFAYSYSWMHSIWISMFLTAVVLGAGGGAFEDSSGGSSEKGPGLLSAIFDTYCEYSLVKAATKDAIRESRQ